MAEKLDPKQVVTFEELVMSVMYEQEASSVSPFLANLTCQMGGEGFLRGAVNNRSRIYDRRVVYGRWGILGARGVCGGTGSGRLFALARDRRIR